MKHIGLTMNREKADAAAVLTRLCDYAKQHELTLFTADDAPGLPACVRRVAPDILRASIDVMIAFGGDGTVLHAARIIGEDGPPLAGVNLGSLGFLTSVAESELERLLDALMNDRCTIADRTVARCRVTRENQPPREYDAVNDVVVGWGSSSRLVTLRLDVDYETVTCADCDGLIVATPTGSTGHSLSAGGPIVHPSSPVFVINIICPHTLSNRPLVLPQDSAVRVTVERASKDLLLAVDGQDRETLQIGESITIERAPHTLRLLNLPEYSYFDLLRRKLHWRGSTV